MMYDAGMETETMALVLAATRMALFRAIAQLACGIQNGQQLCALTDQ